LNSGERTETLMKLGLTLNQARAYLALIQFGPAGAKELAEASGITRQDIYRVMLTLEEKGLVEKLLSSPVVYKAFRIEQVASNLLNRKAEEQNELQKKTQRLITELQRNHLEKPIQGETSQFIMIPGKGAIIQRIIDDLSKTSKSLEVVTSCERFSPAILEFANEYEKALQRGVGVRIAVEKHMAQEAALEVIRRLAKKQTFEVRYFSCSPEAVVSIFDGKKASVTVSKTANSSKACALWSNDPCFVAITRNYFESMWNNSTGFNSAFHDA